MWSFVPQRTAQQGRGAAPCDRSLEGRQRSNPESGASLAGVSSACDGYGRGRPPRDQLGLPGVRGGGQPPWDQLGLRGSGARPHAATPTPTPAHGQPGIRRCGPLLPRLAGSRKPPRCCLHCVVSIGLLLVSADPLLKPEEKQQSVSVNAEKPVGVLA